MGLKLNEKGQLVSSSREFGANVPPSEVEADNPVFNATTEAVKAKNVIIRKKGEREKLMRERRRKRERSFDEEMADQRLREDLTKFKQEKRDAQAYENRKARHIAHARSRKINNDNFYAGYGSIESISCVDSFGGSMSMSNVQDSGFGLMFNANLKPALTKTSFPYDFPISKNLILNAEQFKKGDKVIVTGNIKQTQETSIKGKKNIIKDIKGITTSGTISYISGPTIGIKSDEGYKNGRVVQSGKRIKIQTGMGTKTNPRPTYSSYSTDIVENFTATNIKLLSTAPTETKLAVPASLPVNPIETALAAAPLKVSTPVASSNKFVHPLTFAGEDSELGGLFKKLKKVAKAPVKITKVVAKPVAKVAVKAPLKVAVKTTKVATKVGVKAAVVPTKLAVKTTKVATKTAIKVPLKVTKTSLALTSKIPVVGKVSTAAVGLTALVASKVPIVGTPAAGLIASVMPTPKQVAEDPMLTETVQDAAQEVQDAVTYQNELIADNAPQAEIQQAEAAIQEAVVDQKVEEAKVVSEAKEQIAQGETAFKPSPSVKNQFVHPLLFS